MDKAAPRPIGRPPLTQAQRDERARTSDPRRRVSFTLKQHENKIDVPRLNDRGREQLKILMSDPDLAPQLGVTIAQPAAPGAAASGPTEGLPELCGVLFDALTMVIRSRVSDPQRAAMMGISDEQKRIGAPKVARLVDKYYPNSLGKYEVELDVLLWSLAVVAGNLAILRAEQQKPAAAVVIPEAPSAPSPAVVAHDDAPISRAS